jgi:hypothetical protein
VKEAEIGKIKMNKYIITKSKLVAEVLKKSGYTLLSDKDEAWTFLNCGKKCLSNEEIKEVCYTNKIFL